MVRWSSDDSSGGTTSRGARAGALGLGQALGRGSLAVAVVVLVRYLQPEAYGDLAFAIAFVAISAAFADGGFSRLLVRETARAPGNPVLTVWELLTVRLVPLTAVTVPVTLVAVAGISGFPRGFALLTVAYLTMEAIAFGFENAAVGAERPWRFVVAQSAGALALLGGLAILIKADAVTLASAMALLAGASLVKVIAHAGLWDAPHEISMLRGRPLRVRRRLAQALPFLALTAITTVYYRLGVVLLHLLRGGEETAPYAAAFRVIDAIGVLGAILFAVVAPGFARAHVDSPSEVWALWRSVVARTALVSIPVAALLAIFAEPIAEILFGSRYAESAGADLRLLAPCAAFILLLSATSVVVYMGDDTAGIIRLTGLNLAIIASLTLLLAQLAGDRGAAVATSLAEMLSFSGFALLVWRRYGRAKGPACPNGTAPDPNQHLAHAQPEEGHSREARDESR